MLTAQLLAGIEKIPGVHILGSQGRRSTAEL